MSADTIFPSRVKTFEVLFQPAATGYYIPNYQRPYTWNNENVKQLLSDVVTGIQSLVKSQQLNEEYRFLGTIITVPLTSSRAGQIMYPVDDDAIPSAVNLIIDGQQRLSTLSIFAMVLHDYISWYAARIYKEFKDTDTALIDEVKEICDKYRVDLARLFIVDLGFGNPRYKPMIIRADDDKWTRNGDNDYTSDLAKLISQFCTHDVNTTINAIPYKQFVLDKTVFEGNVGKNFNTIRNILKRALESSNTSDGSIDDSDDDTTLPSASEIINVSALTKPIFMTSRPQIFTQVQNDEINVKEFVQLLGLSFFLLRRCLVNHVEPRSETWAFDMFQALNSTGEPLTSFDIFKAVMLQQLPSDNRQQVKDNITAMYDALEVYLGTSREAKNRKIVQIMTILGLSYGGEQINKLTSAQKKWLTDIYEDNGNPECSHHYQMVIKRIRYTMKYLESIESLQKSKTEFLSGLPGYLPDLKLRNEAMFCLLFLQDAGHSIVQGVLNNAYFQLIEDTSMGAKEEFCQIARAVTAFYALWWPINRTNKLPKIHRDIMSSQGWKKTSRMDVQQIKDELKQHIATLPDRDVWIASAADKLRYGAGSDKLVRLALFVSMWNTIMHNDHLIPMQGSDVSTYLTAERWCSDAFVSIEHIAPQTQTDDWDKDIYPEYVNRIGNLVLLATETNSGTGNKSWAHKWIYYSHTAEKDIAQQKMLKTIAANHNVILDDNVIQKLQQSTYNRHLKPILQLEITYNWDKATIEQRSLDICALLYDRMLEWLQ
jgi:hypothetical protein